MMNQQSGKSSSVPSPVSRRLAGMHKSGRPATYKLVGQFALATVFVGFCLAIILAISPKAPPSEPFPMDADTTLAGSKAMGVDSPEENRIVEQMDPAVENADSDSGRVAAVLELVGAFDSQLTDSDAMTMVDTDVATVLHEVSSHEASSITANQDSLPPSDSVAQGKIEDDSVVSEFDADSDNNVDPSSTTAVAFFKPPVIDDATFLAYIDESDLNAKDTRKQRIAARARRISKKLSLGASANIASANETSADISTAPANAASDSGDEIPTSLGSGLDLASAKQPTSQTVTEDIASVPVEAEPIAAVKVPATVADVETPPAAQMVVATPARVTPAQVTSDVGLVTPDPVSLPPVTPEEPIAPAQTQVMTGSSAPDAIAQQEAVDVTVAAEETPNHPTVDAYKAVLRLFEQEETPSRELSRKYYIALSEACGVSSQSEVNEQLSDVADGILNDTKLFDLVSSSAISWVAWNNRKTPGIAVAGKVEAIEHFLDAAVVSIRTSDRRNSLMRVLVGKELRAEATGVQIVILGTIEPSPGPQNAVIRAEISATSPRESTLADALGI